MGQAELEETKIGRLDHKIEKLKIIKLVPGVEWLHPDARSGDHGITLEEYTPFGVVGAITPSTHSIPTLSGNIVNIVAAGNAVVFNAHPAAARCAAMAVRAYNKAIDRETGIENIACIIEQPTLDSFKAICEHEAVRLLCVTGGPGVVKAAMQTGKRAICAGPGNPPVLVDDTACMKRAAKAIIQGAAYDNNLLCIGEKEVFALDNIADELMTADGKQRRGAVEFGATRAADQSGVHFQRRARRRLSRAGGEQGFHRQRRIGAGQSGRRECAERNTTAVRGNRRGPRFRERGADDAVHPDRAG